MDPSGRGGGGALSDSSSSWLTCFPRPWGLTPAQLLCRACPGCPQGWSPLGSPAWPCSFPGPSPLPRDQLTEGTRGHGGRPSWPWSQGLVLAASQRVRLWRWGQSWRPGILAWLLGEQGSSHTLPQPWGPHPWNGVTNSIVLGRFVQGSGHKPPKQLAEWRRLCCPGMVFRLERTLESAILPSPDGEDEKADTSPGL